MHVVVLVPFNQLPLRVLQGIKCLFGVSGKFDSLIGGLHLLNMLDSIFGGCICIPKIGMMDFISDGGGGEENGTMK